MKGFAQLERRISTLTKTELDRAKEIHEKSIVIDGSQVMRLDHEVLAVRRRGGITASNVTVPYDLMATLEPAYRQIMAHRHFIEGYGDEALVIRTTEDIMRAKKEKKAGIIFGPQNGNPLISDLDDVAFYKWADVRIIQLTYNNRNAIGNGCAEPKDDGLSLFGTEVVEEMNNVGIVVDLSHCGDQTTLEAIEISKDPCIFSHACCRALNPVSNRTKPDESIQALAEKGGVMCCNTSSWCMRVVDNPLVPTPPRMEDLYAHVKHVEELVGIDHIALSTDIDGRTHGGRVMEWYKKQGSKLAMDWMPKLPPRAVRKKWPRFPQDQHGKASVEGFPMLTQVLVAGGYSDQEIEKILGGNLVRLFKRVW